MKALLSVSCVEEEVPKLDLSCLRRSLGLSASPAPDLDVEVSAGIFVTLRPKKEIR